MPGCESLLWLSQDGKYCTDGKHMGTKRSAVSLQGSSVLTKLPPYMTVQMVRFFYKVDTRQKAKILRKVCSRKHPFPSVKLETLPLRVL